MQTPLLKLAPEQPETRADAQHERESDAAIANRIEAIRKLALTLLSEIDALKQSPAMQAVGEFDLRNEVHRFEAENIRYALIRTGGRQRRAARLLNMKVATLNAKIKRYQLDSEEPISARRP